jgi:uroporphyrinogen decarboxylase
MIQQLAVVDEDVLEHFNIDTIELGRGFALEDEDWAEWVLPDGKPCLVPAWSRPERQSNRWVLRSKTGRIIAELRDGTLYFEQTYYPFYDGKEDLDALEAGAEESMWSAIASPPGPVPDPELRAGARRLREKTDRAILGLFGGNLLESGQFYYRNDEFFLLLAGEPRKAHQFLDRLTEIHLKNLENYLGLTGDFIDIIVFGDDLGMQTGPQISPEMYKEFFKPRHRLLWYKAKELADVKVMLHCCGGIFELLPDLIDAGLDAVNPVQISCRNMEPSRLKSEFGSALTFWGGGCDTHRILPGATPQEVTRHVEEQIGILSSGGGFVFQQVHNILSDVPPENIVAMYLATR